MATSTIYDCYTRTKYVSFECSVKPDQSLCCWWDTEPLILYDNDDDDVVISDKWYTCPVQFTNSQQEHTRNGYKFNESVQISDVDATVHSRVNYVGCFCSISCCLAWLDQHSWRDPMYSSSKSLIHMYCMLKNIIVPKKALPPYLLCKFGGTMSVRDYRRACSFDPSIVQTGVVISDNGFHCPTYEKFGNLVMEMAKDIRTAEISSVKNKLDSLLDAALSSSSDVYAVSVKDILFLQEHFLKAYTHALRSQGSEYVLNVTPSSVSTNATSGAVDISLSSAGTVASQSRKRGRPSKNKVTPSKKPALI